MFTDVMFTVVVQLLEHLPQVVLHELYNSDLMNYGYCIDSVLLLISSCCCFLPFGDNYNDVLVGILLANNNVVQTSYAHGHVSYTLLLTFLFKLFVYFLIHVSVT